MAFLSPLRYPGGKGLLLDFISSVIQDTIGGETRYVEPFAGGAAIALGLLSRRVVDRVTIGDLDPSLAAFWRCVFYRSEEFTERIRTCDVTIEAWHEHWNTLKSTDVEDELQLGFAAFFMNRTNRSGILRARPIGGLGQNGDWKLDCRFNKDNLIRRIHSLANFRHRVDIYEGDARELLDGLRDINSDRLFIYADPPYLMKSAGLYLDEMTLDAHVSVATRLRHHFPYWMVSYDQDRRVGDRLFPSERMIEFSIRHSASRAHVGSEVAVFSDDCSFEDSMKFLKSATSIR